MSDRLKIVMVKKLALAREAVQFDGSAGQGSDILAWLLKATGCPGHYRPSGTTGSLFIAVMEGVSRADPGNWIIMAPSGWLDVLTAEAFTEIYQLA